MNLIIKFYKSPVSKNLYKHVIFVALLPTRVFASLRWSSIPKRMSSPIQNIIFCWIMLSLAGGIEGNTNSTGEA